MDKLYVRDKRKVNEKPEDFFNRLYESDYDFPDTFYNKNCTKQQCRCGAKRSFFDLYKVMKTYYSKITHKQLIKIIIDKCTNNDYYNLIYCPDVHKIVLYTGEWEIDDEDEINKVAFNETYYDYRRLFGKNEIKEIDKFTIYYLYKKLGYTTEEIEKQVKKLKTKDE